MIPTVRTLISVPAGGTEMSRGRFLLYTTLGTLIWNGMLAAAGFYLEARYEQVGAYLDPIAKAVMGLIALTYAYRVVTWSPKT
jgi:membrane protein DedA with SNARE-associated domain